MYHYTSVVRYTMPSCDGSPMAVWQRRIPQLSFESEVILNPMLALSALHIHAHSPNDTAMAIALRRYLDRTLVSHRQVLSSGEGLSEHLWLSAVLLSHMHWLLIHQQQPNEAYELPLQAFKMLEGMGVLFAQNKVVLEALGYDWYGNEGMHHMAPDDELSTSAQMQLHGIEEDLAQLLNAFNVPALPEDDKNIYMEVRDYVIYHYRAFYSSAGAKTFQRFIAIMAERCQPGYRKMLERHDPLAMALMARILVLLSGVNHAWWMKGEGDYEVIGRDVRGIRGLMPPDLQWTMDWPCKVLYGEIVLKD